MGGPRDLLVRYREGDPDALDQLIAEMGPRLKGFFIRQGAQGSTAEDLVQDVFVRVLNSVQGYRPAGRLDAYLLRIARNLWIDSRRKKRPISIGENLPDSEAPQEGPVAAAERKDRAVILRQLLAQCDPMTRELLELAVLQRLPYQEVSSILGVPVGTVKSRVFYSLRRLRDSASSLDPSREGEDS